MASSKSKSRDSGKRDKSTKAKNVSKKSPAPAAYKSEEFVQDSDEEEIEKDEAADEDSDEGSDSDESLPSANQSKAESKANRKMPAPAGSSSSSEGESAESDESSEDEEDSEDGTQTAPVAIEPTKQLAKQPATKTVSFQAPPPYRPPPGFDLASPDGTLKASQMLKKSSLEGKQIWYFTAPASVPISSIKAMSLLDATNGKSVLTHDGNDYGFIKDSVEDTAYTRIMVPSSDAGYKAASKSIDQVFHLQQIAQDPTAANPGRATIPARKPVRQQPRGLKMRFHPIGFGAAGPGTIGSSSSDEEMEDVVSTTHRSVSNTKSINKSGSETTDSDEEMAESPALPSRPHPDIVTSSSDITSKKEKKRKHSEGGEKKSKHSSSSAMSSIDHRELKRLKKKQTESQRKLADNPSVSTEDQENIKPPLPLRPKTPPRHLVSTTPIPPPAPLTFSQPSAAKTGLHHSRSSSKKSKPTEEYHSSSMTPSSGHPLPPKDSTQATDTKLTAEERWNKMKKLKHKDAKRQKGSPE
ncbi:DNA-directed RNA polymerase I subunit RPA34.5-domain-containing protein [Rhexocercosporidium sp. MPI-PUGE-AT-0058]|nr:DNA-directed RNA polymerase I subunit RPA34.5-domain-containing protein [Rhexocercosporidium sp. MPI-PUGE-AT-0058]